MALSLGLDTAVKALRAHQLAVDVAAHNIANANSPGFSRQRVLLRPLGPDGSDHLTRDALIGRTGYGVDASDVNRVRNVFIDYQQRTAFASLGQSQALASALATAEIVFNDPTDDGLSELLSQFWNSWHDVANDPESSAARTSLVHVTTTLTTRLQRAYNQLSEQRTDLNYQVDSIASVINSHAAEIAALNFQIQQVELNGDAANDLRDRRDLLIDQLSMYGNVSYTELADKTVTVHFGDHLLVERNTANRVEALDDGNGMRQVHPEGDATPIAVTGGELRGVLDARDADLPALLAKLDALAEQLISSVNAVHQAGYALDGTTGLDFFTGTGAADIAVGAALIANPALIAAAANPNAPGDATVARAIADLQQARHAALNNQTFGEYYANTVTVLGADVNRANGLVKSSELLTDHLEALRQSVQGVNIDEEVTNMNAAQYAYQAAARVITTIDEMLDVLINRTGVVGR